MMKSNSKIHNHISNEIHNFFLARKYEWVKYELQRYAYTKSITGCMSSSSITYLPTIIHTPHVENALLQYKTFFYQVAAVIDFSLVYFTKNFRNKCINQHSFGIYIYNEIEIKILTFGIRGM